MRHMTKQPKSSTLNIRVPESLRASCEAAAEKRGLDLSSWIRMVLTDATRSK